LKIKHEGWTKEGRKKNSQNFSPLFVWLKDSKEEEIVARNGRKSVLF